MNDLNWLIIELGSEPENELLASWLLERLLEERDMTHAEAARHVEKVRSEGRAVIAVLQNFAPLTNVIVKRRRKSR